MKKEKVKENNASMILGIISICLSFLNWIAMLIAIVGLCVQKKGSIHSGRDIALNLIGLILSIIWFFVLTSLYL